MRSNHDKDGRRRELSDSPPLSGSAYMSTERLLTVLDVCDLLQVTSSFVYRHAADLGAIKVGSHLRFHRQDLENWLTRGRPRGDDNTPEGDCHPHMDNEVRDWSMRPAARRQRRS